MYKVYEKSTSKNFNKRNNQRVNLQKIRIKNNDDLLNGKVIKYNYEEKIKELNEKINELIEDKNKYEENIFELNQQINDYEQKLENSNLILDENFKTLKEEEDVISKLRKDNIQLKKYKLNKNKDDIDRIIKNSEKILRKRGTVV